MNVVTVLISLRLSIKSFIFRPEVVVAPVSGPFRVAISSASLLFTKKTDLNRITYFFVIQIIAIEIAVNPFVPS